MQVRERKRVSKRTGKTHWVYVMDYVVSGRRRQPVIEGIRAETQRERKHALKRARARAEEIFAPLKHKEDDGGGDRVTTACSAPSSGRCARYVYPRSGGRRVCAALD